MRLFFHLYRQMIGCWLPQHRSSEGANCTCCKATHNSATVEMIRIVDFKEQHFIKVAAIALLHRSFRMPDDCEITGDDRCGFFLFYPTGYDSLCCIGCKGVKEIRSKRNGGS